MTIDNDMLHHATDHTPYAGQTVRGWPVMTISRGDIVWNDGEITSQAGRGQFIARQRPFPPQQESVEGAVIMTRRSLPATLGGACRA